MIAAEQKARTTYDNILRLVDDPDVRDVIKFLREREVVHYQRFGEGLRIATDKMNEKNFYAFNPSFDTGCNKKMRWFCLLTLCLGADFLQTVRSRS